MEMIKSLKLFTIKMLRRVNGLVVKDKRLWLFGAWGGKNYSDNTKFLFEYVNEHCPEIKAVWMTQDQEVLTEVQSKGYSCLSYKSLKAIWYVMRAGAVFETEGELDISQYLPYCYTHIFQLWHGMGAKAMKWKDPKTGKVNLDGEETMKCFSSYYWMATSEMYRETFHELTHAPKEKMFITGYPRNDSFVTKPENDNMEKLKAEYPGSKWIIYMPTHRNFGKAGNDYINLNALKNVDRELRKKNVFMVYKPHVHELQNFLEYEDDFTNIVLAKDQKIWGDVYSYLHYFDLLISDYSSVSTDFMCSGKPVVLFTYDIEDYKTGDAGLMDYFWTLPGGPICTSWEDTLKNTFDLLENDTWKEERERCRIAYHLYNDGHNAERVCRKAYEILKLEPKKKAN